MTKLIVAVGPNLEIGKDNKIPWSCSEDLKLFKELTTGNVVLMGRNTYESIGRPLPNRTTIVITGNEQYDLKWENTETTQCYTQKTMPPEVLEGKDYFFAGGSMIYEKVVDLVDELYISFIDANLVEKECDKFFPLDLYMGRYYWEFVSHKRYDGFHQLVLKKLGRKNNEN